TSTRRVGPPTARGHLLNRVPGADQPQSLPLPPRRCFEDLDQPRAHVMQCSTHVSFEQDEVATIIMALHGHDCHMGKVFWAERSEQRYLTQLLDIDGHHALLPPLLSNTAYRLTREP